MSDWFVDESEVQDEGFVVPFFDLKKNESVRVTFLDPDPSDKYRVPPVLKVYKIFGYKNEEDKYPSYVLCPSAKGEVSPLLEYGKTLDEDDDNYKMLQPTNFYCYTVLRQDKNEDSGEWFRAKKQVRLTNVKQKNIYLKKVEEVKNDDGMMKDFDGLYGNTFTVSRPDEAYVPRIGVIGNPVGKADLSDLHDSPQPFTPQELISLFETDVSDMEAFVERLAGSGFKKPEIK